MGTEARRILQSALALSERERADLAVELLASLDGESDPDAEQAWVEEITRRAESIEAGQSKGIPWETVKREVRSVLSRK